MSFFDRFFGPHAITPEWARFFTDEEFAAFMGALHAELSRRALPFEVGDGVVRLELPSHEGHQLGMQNLAQLCHREPRERWSALIAEHFDNIIKSYEESHDVEQREGELARVKELLKVRLYGSSFGEEAGDQLIHRPLTPGIEAAVVYDLPSTVRSVARGRLDAWGCTEDELFRTALDNVAREPPPEHRKIDVGNHVHVDALLGDSFFTTSHALRLEAFIGGPAPHGALLALPHRHAVLFHTIRDARVVTAINGLITMAFGMYQEGPGSLTPNLYWWREGKLLHLPTEVSANRVIFDPPAAFTAALGELTGGRRGPMN